MGECNVQAVGKRRDGRTRYWCTTHKANSTGKHGVRKALCDRANEKAISKKQTLVLDPTDYKGGIAVWGAVAPVYSTACHDEPEIGVHVHARRRVRQKKFVDMTYKLVRVREPSIAAKPKYFDILERDATQFLISSVFGMQMSFIECTYCGSPHLDEDLFSVSPHRKHLCFACGRDFLQKRAGIGNPLVGVQALFEGATKPRKVVPANRNLDIRQSEFPSGIELWGSNPAILWTSKSPEECGIHFHGYTDNFVVPTVDETFDNVTIDGISIDEKQLRVLMAQQHLPHLRHRITSLACPKCEEPHFDTGELAYTPHAEHHCRCGVSFQAEGRLRLVVSNPIVAELRQLECSTKLKRRNFS